MFIKKLQKHHILLIIAAITLNVVGFSFGLFVSPGPYDEIAHVFTPFVITYLIYTFAVLRYKQVDISNSIPLLLSIACISITLCVLWEVFEWSLLLKYFSADLTHNLDDTMTDLVYGGIGSSSITLIVHIKQQLIRARQQKKISWNMTPHQTFDQTLKQNENLY